MPVAEKQDGGSNVGVIVGVLIAVVAVIVAGVLAGIFILRLRNKRQNWWEESSVLLPVPYSICIMFS